MHTTIERELEFHLMLSPERSVPVSTRLLYQSADPYAVHLTFHFDSQAPVHWTFARELLVEGVFRPSGHGDVRVWPGREGSHKTICLALNSPDGTALLQAPASPVSAWLEHTMRAVPPGSEGGQSDLEQELLALLTPSCGDEFSPRDHRPTDDSAESGS